MSKISLKLNIQFICLYWKENVIGFHNSEPVGRILKTNYSYHSEGIRFTRNRQNTRSLGEFLAGNPTRIKERLKFRVFCYS